MTMEGVEANAKGHGSKSCGPKARRTPDIRATPRPRSDSRIDRPDSVEHIFKNSKISTI